MIHRKPKDIPRFNYIIRLLLSHYFDHNLSLSLISVFLLWFFIMLLAETSHPLSSPSAPMLEDNLSRLSVCTSSMYTLEDVDYQDCDGMSMYMSRLSFETFDADEELSDDQEGIGMLPLSSDSDEEPVCYSLPATPHRGRNLGGLLNKQLVGVKQYASENEAPSGKMRENLRRRKSRSVREILVDSDDESQKKDGYGNCNTFSRDSEGGGLVVITRPKGGRRSLCMDFEEVKACRDLGFELEHERMLEMPGRVSLSGSTLETSSGGTSPIANWRISSPGDDPREVKARLKVWAQAVALASTFRHGGF